MEHQSLTPATQAVLDALTTLGQGNVQELADTSGKARSTTDRAIKALAEAGLIVAVDTDADAAESTPTRWTLATPAEATDTAPQDTDQDDEHTAGTDAPEHADPSPDAETGEPDSEPAGTPDGPVDNGGDGDIGQDGGTGQDEGGDADGTEPETDPGDQGDVADTDEPTDLDDQPDAGDGGSAGDGEDEAPAAAVVQPARPGDRKVMAIKGVLADHGDDGATLDVIVAESGIGHATATRLLTAMEQADAARRLPGLPQRWIPGPTKASEVDPNPEPPRCPLCHQVIRGLATAPDATATVRSLIRPDGTLHIVAPDGETHVVDLPTRTPPRTAGVARSAGRRGDGTVNTDGSQPFGRGELEKLTLDVLAAHPGHAMTPQDIATAISAQLHRAVSSGAVRNNCTKAAAAGRILLVSDAPLTFAYPAPTGDGPDGQADPS
ncbi:MULTISPECIES: helix-turn-helix domain-containing protein [unclassified Micromonospora]|uniref:MarR family transcriptional regulator n=1 Tax=unclassified Micromonospora TaxID=2617518 RepID=UPI00098D318A|nr:MULTISPECIES: helix-turn-helix domain-containing protein [unclassified Micromonospora]OON28192.1 hypothetical protein BSA16_27965 [Micromonospora sp. Rc5]